jgi:DNA-binding response OmpR family regulator
MEFFMKPTLLIAESNAELRAAHRRFLTAHGYDVETAVDGLDCLEKLRQGSPAVLVLDRELPWGGGDGVLAWLREEGSASGVPVVLTATAGHGPDVEGIEPPVVQLLAKPFALTALLDSLRAVLARREHEEAFNGHCAPVYPELFLG